MGFFRDLYDSVGSRLFPNRDKYKVKTTKAPLKDYIGGDEKQVGEFSPKEEVILDTAPVVQVKEEVVPPATQDTEQKSETNVSVDVKKEDKKQDNKKPKNEKETTNSKKAKLNGVEYDVDDPEYQKALLKIEQAKLAVKKAKLAAASTKIKVKEKKIDKEIEEQEDIKKK